MNIRKGVGGGCFRFSSETVDEKSRIKNVNIKNTQQREKERWKCDHK